MANAKLNLSINALAVQEVMTRFTIGKDGPWDGAEPKELAAVLQGEIQKACQQLSQHGNDTSSSSSGGSSSKKDGRSSSTSSSSNKKDIGEKEGNNKKDGSN